MKDEDRINRIYRMEVCEVFLRFRATNSGTGEGRKSDSRYRALRKVRQKFFGDFTQGGVLADSHFALGYYLSPLAGLSVCGFADRSNTSPMV